MRNQTHAGESAGRTDGRIGISGERKICLRPDFAGAACNRRRDILGKAKKPVESRHVEGHGVGPIERTGSFHNGREFEGERGQIARAVKTGEHCFLR